MKVYHAVVEQRDRGGVLWQRETFDVRARTAGEALRRVVSLARRNGFVKSVPLSITELRQVVGDLR